MFYRRQLLKCSIFVLLLPAFCPAQSAAVDSTSTRFHSKYCAKQPWERVVSFPGMVAYLPFQAVFYLSERFIAYSTSGYKAQKILDFLTTDDGKRGIFPTYAASTGAGYMFFQKEIFKMPESRFTFKTTFGLKGRSFVQVNLEKIQLPKRFFMGMSVQYHLMPDESYFGTPEKAGMDSRFEDRNIFSQEQAKAQISLGGYLLPGMTLDALGSFENINIHRGRGDDDPAICETFNVSSLPGLTTRTKLARFEFESILTTHKTRAYPSNGLDFILRGGIANEVGDSQYGFYNYAADVKQTINLFYGRCLALRVAGEVTRPLGAKKIPFYYLSEMGRFSTIRGLVRGRYRDRDMIYGSLEYIYPIRMLRGDRISSILFLDAGQVGNNLISSMEFENFVFTYGFGFQFSNADGLIARLELGFSPDGYKIHFKI
ncbi:hypothetical protein JW935_22505 [candidate division KSB1 bacterium]|nr:hypothetical protein [candidate division KSB1 bacterium]